MGSDNTDQTDYAGLIDRRLDARLVWALVAILLVAHAALAWSSREIGVLTAQDDARYLLLTRSLRDLGYRDLFLVGLPSHNLYPPGYPVFLVLWSLFAGVGFTSAVVANILLSTAALGVAFLSIRRIWSPAGALLCLTCLAVNPGLLARAGSVRSESLYMLLTLIALWALTWTTASSRRLMLAAGAAILAGLTRTIGVSLIAAIVIAWLLQRRGKAAAGLIAGSGATVGVWLLWSAAAASQFHGDHYFVQAVAGTEGSLLWGFAQRIGTLVPGYAVLSTPWVLALPTIEGSSVDNAVWAILVIAGILAGMKEMARRWPVVPGYLLLYALILSMWPWYLSRFLEPIVPLLLPALLLGLGLLTRRLGERWSMGVMLAMTIFMVGGGMARTVERIGYRRGCGPLSLEDPPPCIQEDRASYLRALHFVDTRTPPGAVFLTGKPEPLYYYTGRRSVRLEWMPSVEAGTFLETLDERGVDYVLLGSLHVDELERLHPLLQEDCDAFDVEAFFEPRTYLLRVGRQGNDRQGLEEGTAEGLDEGTAEGTDEGNGVAGGRDACGAMNDYERDSAGRDFGRDNWRAD